ncbi:MAG TPA: hypothetical protein PLG17_03810 [Thermodesulfobacteriota bacterium]|nr:hypothetical protein [Thermodesulfobacteriota bacterium]
MVKTVYKMLRCIGLLGLSLLVYCFDVDSTQKMLGPAAAEAAPGQIADVCVTNVYTAYETPTYYSKFVLVFDRSAPVPDPVNDVWFICIQKPDGLWEFMRNRPYTRTTANGYLYSPGYSLWYQKYLTGTIADGTYRFFVVFKDGTYLTKSRTLVSNWELVNTYIAYQSAISFYPNGVVVQDQPVGLYWTTIASLGGPGLYYNAWVMGDNGIVRSDGIFMDPNPSAGLDKNSSMQYLPGGNYQWFTEVLDSNRFGQINMVIFQPWNYFNVP